MRVLRDHGPAPVPAAPAAAPAPPPPPIAAPARPAAPAPLAAPLPPPVPLVLEPAPGPLAPLAAPLEAAPSLEDAIAAESLHPQSARIAETAAVARAALEGLDRTEVVTSEAPGALTLESAGQARVLGPRTLRLPLVLRDAEGRRQSLSLTLELRPDEDDA
jgi:hypothetical protein